MISVRRCSIDCLVEADALSGLLAEYAEECGNALIGTPAPQVATYKAMSDSGKLVFIGAYDGDGLIGFASLLFSELPHYGKVVGVTESLFVGKNHRHSKAGLMLLAASEEEAKQAGAVALLVSSNVGSQLARLLDAKKSYVETNRVFTKCLL